MWIFTNDAFVSIVAHNEDDRILLVRARRRADLTRLFPGREADVVSLEGSDYPFRLFLTRAEVRNAIDARLAGIDYPNFKGSVSRDEDDRHDFYSRVWREGLYFEERFAPYWGDEDAWDQGDDDLP